MLKRIITAAVVACLLTTSLDAQTVKEFKDAVDSLQTLMVERTRVSAQVKANKVVRRGYDLDFYFTPSMGDFPWRTEDVEWLRRTLKRHSARILREVRRRETSHRKEIA